MGGKAEGKRREKGRERTGEEIKRKYERESRGGKKGER